MITRPKPSLFANQADYSAAVRKFEADRSLGAMVIEPAVAHPVRQRSHIKTTLRRWRSQIMNRFCRCK